MSKVTRRPDLFQHLREMEQRLRGLERTAWQVGTTIGGSGGLTPAVKAYVDSETSFRVLEDNAEIARAEAAEADLLADIAAAQAAAEAASDPAGSAAAAQAAAEAASVPLGATQHLYEWRIAVPAVGILPTRLHLPVGITILGVSASADTAPSGASMVFQIRQNDASNKLFTTNGFRPAIGSNAHYTTATNGGSGAEAVPDVTALSALDYLKLEVVSVGTTVVGANISVVMRYRF